MKENFLCLIELLKFEKLPALHGDDMLKITLNRIFKDLSEAMKGYEERLSCSNFGTYILIETKSNSDEDLSAIVNMLSAYNKQALMFGYPHKGILIHQRSINSDYQGVSVCNSKALFTSIEKLANLSTAGLVVDNDLFCEKQEFFNNCVSLFEQFPTFKIQKAKLTDIALNGVKKSLESTFAKLGINRTDSNYNLLDSALRFIESENR